MGAKPRRGGANATREQVLYYNPLYLRGLALSIRGAFIRRHSPCRFAATLLRKSSKNFLALLSCLGMGKWLSVSFLPYKIIASLGPSFHHEGGGSRCHQTRHCQFHAIRPPEIAGAVLKKGLRGLFFLRPMRIYFHDIGPKISL